MNEESGREFGWDDVIQNDGQEFEPIPEGDYDFVIDKFERSRSSGSARMLSGCGYLYRTYLRTGAVFLERGKGYPGRSERPHDQCTAVWMDSIPEHDRV